MIEHGPDIQLQIENDATRSDIAVAKIIQYNCHQSHRKRVTAIKHHSKERETPFVIYVGLLLFAKTRKRQMIDTLHQLAIGNSSCPTFHRRRSCLSISAAQGFI